MIFIVCFGKLLRMLTRLAGGGGSAVPGYVIERLAPGFLKRALDQLPQGVIVVTGTNGKTTTTKLISDLLATQNLKVLTNRSGGNFVRGIISTIVQRANWFGRLNYDIAVFEQDEAYAVRFVRKYHPRGVVALNVGRDQMDRFGEIDKTAELIGQVVAAAKQFAVLNANDPRIANLRSKIRASASIHWFGHSERLATNFASDDQHYAAKAEFFQAAQPQVTLEKFKAGETDVRIAGEPYKLKTTLPGSQNALNVVAALAALMAVSPKASMALVAESLASVEPAFGRGEVIKLKDGAQLRLQLIKNPASFKHNLQHLEDDGYAAIGIAINDDYADGRDVSWLWDVDFSGLAKQPRVYCGGTRAYDMAVRLKYDGVNANDQTVALAKFLPGVLNAAGAESSVIFCTYTAMLKLRKLLKPFAVGMESGIKG